MEQAAVECHAGYAYPQRPIAFAWLDQRCEVAQVDAEWRTPDGKGFRVRTREGQLFDLFYRALYDLWDITPVSFSAPD